MELKLDEMSLEELRSLRGQIDRALTSYSERKRRDAIAAAEEAARKHGFSSLADLTGNRRRTSRSTKATRPASDEAKYSNPEDPGQTWSGRGRRPRWIQEAIAAGRSLEDFAR